MKVLVTGAAGMLGSGLVPAFVSAGHSVVATDINLAQPRPWGPAGPALARLDVRDRAQVTTAMREVRPDLVCHLAAETSLEYSDAHEEHAYATNTLATKFVALEAGRAEIPLVYISTAGVFDGLKVGAYHEWDAPNPLNVYGRTKYEGELLVERFAPQSFTIRAGWMVGGGAKDHKFVAKIVEQVRAGRTRLHAVTDKFGTPTYVPDFARTLLNLLPTESYGLYHMACEGDGNRYDVAAAILSTLGLEGEIELVEVGSEFFADDYPSVRPRSEIMRNLHLELQGLNTMRHWRVALEEYLWNEFGDIGRNFAGSALDLAEAEHLEVALQEDAAR
jgi:dTDP-4-dehydrorhamnose reductase